jgi:hypothetical protein
MPSGANAGILMVTVNAAVDCHRLVETMLLPQRCDTTGTLKLRLPVVQCKNNSTDTADTEAP